MRKNTIFYCQGLAALEQEKTTGVKEKQKNKKKIQASTVTAATGKSSNWTLLNIFNR